MSSTAIVLACRFSGYFLAFGALFVIERFQGLNGLAFYGVLLTFAATTRYATLGLADLYLLRVSSKETNQEPYIHRYLALAVGVSSLAFIFLLTTLTAFGDSFLIKFGLVTLCQTK